MPPKVDLSETTILRFTFFLLLLVVAGTSRSYADSPEEQPLRRIAFGSCAKQDQPQPIWDSIVDLKPQVFVFLGDNIYGDTNDMAVLKKKWDLLGAQPGYQKLKQSCRVLATWDDHDYGADDAGTEYPWKRESQQLFLDLSEMMRLPPGATALGYPLFEATSSSLNAPSGNFTKAGIRFRNEINSYRVGLTYFDTNFGFIDVDWTANPPVIRLQVRDEKGEPVLQQKFKLSDLQSP